MNKPFYIPPQNSEPEPLPPPPGAAFRKHPTEQIAPGDLVMVGVNIYRVKQKRGSKSSPQVRFVLYPVLGGLIITESWFPRQWVPSVLQDTEGDTRPMPAVTA